MKIKFLWIINGFVMNEIALYIFINLERERERERKKCGGDSFYETKGNGPQNK